ncbi:MAG: 1,2-phenylacetyl-CoA epoxidase subunit PaaD [Bacteroidia bacterium]
MLETKAHILSLLSEIPDPEIPVISIVELGVVRDITISGDEVELKITPTYSGCPAMKQMEDDIRKTFKANHIDKFKIVTTYSPPWTTDWMSAETKEKLRNYGIAPPEQSTQDKSFLTGKPKTVSCPRCRSTNTKLISQFGSTACKALYQCQDCLEPFDYFKCI